jgi:hypothetical protein
MSSNSIGRFLIDYENPDAGIGHSMGHINNAYKTCLRNNLQFAFTSKQLRKSTQLDWQWKLQKIRRLITGRKPRETHNLGDSINELFRFDASSSKTRDEVEELIKKQGLRVIQLPKPMIEIPSNLQNDQDVYRDIDQVIRNHPEDGTVFILPNKRTGDFEYAPSINWLNQCYSKARTLHPLNLSYENGVLSIAVHIRRGDLLPGRQYSNLANRMLPDSWYINIIEAILDTTKQKAMLVILSEGVNGRYCSEKGEDFSWVERFGSSRVEVIEMIDTSFNESFHHMKSSNILIGSKSGMSHLAGMLNEGIKIMPKMWHSYRGTNSAIEIEDDLLEPKLIEIKKILLSNFI